MTPEEFRRFGHDLIDRIAEYRENAAGLPVLPRVEPGALRTALPADPPERPEPFGEVLADVDRLILPALTNWQHPNFFAFFPSNAELSAVLGDLLSTGLGVVGLSWQACPALTELEEVVNDWLRRMVGLSDAWSGVIQDTASTATLTALLCAREKSTRYSLDRAGLQGEERPLAVYVSEQSHSSVEKAALLAGFGRANVRRIAVDENFGMRADALARAIEEDRGRGIMPCAVVATTGTTATTALDPLEEIAKVAGESEIWMHVDAAMAGTAMILPECRWMWRGVEAADSLVLNPHKWLGVPPDCSLYYVRDPEHLVRVMSTNPSYLRSAMDERVTNYRDWGIPLGRRFRALKLWFLIRSEGVENLRARLRRDIENARWLESEVVSRKNWRVLAPVVLQTVCLRHEPAGLAGEALDRHTLDWAERVNRSGRAYLTPAILGGRWMVRVSVGMLATEREHVAALWELLKAAAEDRL